MKNVLILFIVEVFLMTLLLPSKIFAQQKIVKPTTKKSVIFPVAFTNAVLYDSTKYYITSKGAGVKNPYRPIYVHIWYPADKVQNPSKLKFSDYVYTGLSTKQISLLTSIEKDSLKSILVNEYDYFSLDETQVERTLSMPMKSMYKATPAKNKFPMLVISGATNGRPYHFSTLAETFAASGMVVVAMSSLGENDTTNCQYDAKCLLSQVDDLQKVIDFMKRKNYVDTFRISALAWSFGGLSAVLHQQKFNQFKTMISLDAAIGYKYGKELMETSKLFNLEKFSIPILHFQSTRSGERIPQDLSFFEAIASKTKQVSKNNSLLHADFTSIFGDILRYGKKEVNAGFTKSRMEVEKSIIAFLKQNQALELK